MYSQTGVHLRGDTESNAQGTSYEAFGSQNDSKNSPTRRAEYLVWFAQDMLTRCCWRR
jgi:hypothetical protein